MDEDFLLESDLAKQLFHHLAENMPIFDYHNHLNAKEIYENACYDNLTQAWLGGDHYKWRAMRAYGIDEELITGQAEDYEKFLAYVKTVQTAIGNPLYHWSHLELQRYFHVNETINEENAKTIWEKCNNLLQTREYSIQNLLRSQKVEILCTTNDPTEDLEYHKKLKSNPLFEIQVLPTFRPDKALGMENEGFQEYISLLAETVETDIEELKDLEDALRSRLDFFSQNGCLVSDHGIEQNLYALASGEEVESIFKKKMSGEAVTDIEAAKFRGYFLVMLGKEYAKRGIVMQLHIGAYRNNSTRLFEQLGTDIGCDSMNDFSYAPQLSQLLNAMDKTGELPKTILYCLNPKDSEMLACMCGNFQGNGIKGKVQFGTAWWFNDHKQGIENYLEVMGHAGLLSTYIGMLTDSRSFLSFTRHEYFRRILCNYFGKLVENGEYPMDEDSLSKLVRGICYENAKEYFTL